MTEDIDRKTIYDNIGIVGKSLLDDLYGVNNFINKTYTSPLEKYIISFDENIEDERMVLNIGNRIGISVSGLDRSTGEYELVSTQLYGQLQGIIDIITFKFSKLKRVSRSKSINPIIININNISYTLEDVIDMSKNTFKNIYKLLQLKNVSNEDLIYQYENRLVLFLLY